MSDFVLSQVDARGIATITLNRPDKANAYDYGMLEAVGNHFEHHGADAKVRAIVLRGSGKHFSAGADVQAGAEPPAGSARRGLGETCALIDETPKPTIALVQGACVGGGMGLASCCDIVLADRSAFFSVPEVRLGFTPGPLSLYFSRALGVRAFRRYGMTGERFGAEEGLRVGFVHELCDAGGLDTALAKQVEEILMAAPFAAMGAKSIALRLQAGQIPRGLEHQLEAEFVQSRGSAEAVEGKASFTQKRKPNWYKAKAGS
jgi:methylglutaconyl-CoA hydratase